MTVQQETCERFRKLHDRAGAFVIPNPWDAGSARILSALGFEALATTSAGFAFSIGRRDSSGGITRNEILENARSIVEATILPVSADLEDGFGAEPEECAITIQRASEVGLVGGSIEDATGDASNPIFEFAQAVERVAAAAEAARSLPLFRRCTSRFRSVVVHAKRLKIAAIASATRYDLRYFRMATGAITADNPRDHATAISTLLAVGPPSMHARTASAVRLTG